MKHALITSSIYSILFLFNFYLAERIRKHFTKFQEISRKAVHISSGLIALSFPYYIHSHWTVLILVTIFGLLMFVTKRKNLLQSIHDVGRKSYGSLYYPLAIYLIFLLASKTPVIYFTSILVMTVSDAFAALVGKKYGTVKFEVEGNIKSLEGSVSFFFLSFLCVLLPLLLMSDIEKLEVVFISLIISLLLTGFEAISPTGSDNIIIPFGTYFLISKMSALPLSTILQDFYILFGTVVATAMVSLLQPGGLIGMMLLNYAALTLGNVYWAIPLFMAEVLLFLLITLASSKEEKEKFSIHVLFYLGIIPTSFIFIANALKNDAVIFIPFLISIVAQIPLSYSYYLHRTKKYSRLTIQFLAQTAVILTAITSLRLFYGYFNVQQALGVIGCSIFISVINKLIHQQFNPEKIISNEYRIRAISTLAGSGLGLMLSHSGVLNV